MKQEKILAIAETMSVDQIDGLILQLYKLKKHKNSRKNNLRITFLSGRKDLHPLCKI